jgi:hypothetical protein
MKRISALTLAISIALSGHVIAQERNEENNRQPPEKTQQQRGEKAQRGEQRGGERREGQGGGERRGGQGGGERRGGQGGGGGNLLFTTLDVDGNGTLSSKEIENALAALMKLDKNKDGQLTSDELRSRGGGRGGQGGGKGGGGQSVQGKGGQDRKEGGKGGSKNRDQKQRERE